MQHIEQTVEVSAPVRTVYNQWTQFEEFPKFLDGVKAVHQLDDTHLRWYAAISGKDKQWDARITEQVPDRVIAWRSTSGAANSGAVRFESLAPERTRVHLSLDYEPEGVLEKTGDALGVVENRVQKSLEQFREFLEARGRESGAWRGEVHGGEKPPSRGGAPHTGL